MNFLVTGGAGFIGSNLVKALLNKNYSVKVIDNFMTGKKENLSDVAGAFELYEEDIRNYEKIKPLFKGVDYVLHQAAIPSVARSIDDPFTANECNITGTLNVLKCAADHGIKRVVAAGSSSVYGDSPTLPKKETMLPNPKSPYAVTKLTTEYYAKVFAECYNLQTVVLRYFNVFGPAQDPNSMYGAAIPKFVTAFIKGEKITVFGDGEQTRDFTYVDNVVDANIKACFAENASGKAVNIGCGGRISLNKLIAVLKNISDKETEVEYAEERAGDVRDSLASIEEAQKWIGYSPIVTLEAGLKLTYDWFCDKYGGEK